MAPRLRSMMLLFASASHGRVKRSARCCCCFVLFAGCNARVVQCRRVRCLPTTNPIHRHITERSVHASANLAHQPVIARDISSARKRQSLTLASCTTPPTSCVPLHVRSMFEILARSRVCVLHIDTAACAVAFGVCLCIFWCVRALAVSFLLSSRPENNHA